MIKPLKKIYIAESSIQGAGRGVFADEDIKESETIEICPVLPLHENDYKRVKNTLLRNYYFMWDNACGLALGYGSIYNHSYKPNATYKKMIKGQTIHFIARKDIEKDEEITVNYNYGNPDDKSPLWIDDIRATDED